MRHLRVAISNPSVWVQEGETTWLVTSSHRNDVTRLSRVSAASPEQWARATADLVNDGVVVRIERDSQGAPVSLHAFRGVTTSDEVFFAQGTDGSLVLTDHARNAITIAGLREASDEGLLDCLLFRTVPGTSSPVQALQRLGHGEAMDWSQDGIRRWLVQVLEPAPGDDLTVDSLAHLLGAAVEPLVGRRELVNMLSGGVDSTLLQTYFGPRTVSMSVALDSPEFEFEVAYARRASELLAARHHVVPLAEEAYAPALEAATDASGLPMNHPQSVLMDTAFRQPQYREYVSGQFADAVFGTSAAARASVAWRYRRWLKLPGLCRALTAVRRADGRRCRDLVRSAARLKRPLDHPEGFAMQFATYTDLAILRRCFPAEAIERRLRARFDYAMCRVPHVHTGRSSVGTHLEAGHWIDFFCDDTVSHWRQLAHASGKLLHSPFTDSRLVRGALTVPSPDRYVSGRRAKHFLKDLLASRLPTYDVDQRKGGSNLPFMRLLESGRLRELADDVAEVSPETARVAAAVKAYHRPSQLTWNLLAYGVWYQRMLMRQRVELLPGTRVLSWHAANATPPAGP